MKTRLLVFSGLLLAFFLLTSSEYIQTDPWEVPAKYDKMENPQEANSTSLKNDGALFYKTLEGRDDMPNFKKKIPYEEDIWDVVNYVRTFQ
jgi:hypothetical protein